MTFSDDAEEERRRCIELFQGVLDEDDAAGVASVGPDVLQRNGDDVLAAVSATMSDDAPTVPVSSSLKYAPTASSSTSSFFSKPSWALVGAVAVVVLIVTLSVYHLLASPRANREHVATHELHTNDHAAHAQSDLNNELLLDDDDDLLDEDEEEIATITSSMQLEQPPPPRAPRADTIAPAVGGGTQTRLPPSLMRPADILRDEAQRNQNAAANTASSSGPPPRNRSSAGPPNDDEDDPFLQTI